MKDLIRLIAEHSLTYAPHHVAEKLGYFADAGVEVATSYQSGPGGSWLADVLARGEADIARGGVWIPMMYRGHLEDLRIFAALCHRNTQVLLSRRSEPGFTMKDLIGRRVLLPMAATSQWMYIRGLFEEAGLPWHKVQWLCDLEGSTMRRLWRSGYADHLLASSPAADELLAEGYHAALEIADTGAVPWSVYYAPAATAQRRAGVLTRFTAALGRASAWINEAPAAESARLLAPDFPGHQTADLARSIERMRIQNTWSPDMRVPEAPLARYQSMIASYGLIPAPLPHGEIVAPEIAQASLSLRHEPPLAALS